MHTIFISYRRDETAGEARALCNDLESILGKDSVFMDVDKIALGRDFRQVLRERLESCDVMLALVGRNWVDAKNSSGQRRLEDPDDFVRLELAAALKRNIPVTPVLVQGAQMPTAAQLPEGIRDFAYRNGFELSHNRWESDVQEMIKRLGLSKQPDSREIRDIETGSNAPREAGPEPVGQQPSRMPWPTIVAVSVLAIALVGVGEASLWRLFFLLLLLAVLVETLAVLVENGLALIFRWRPFLDYFDSRTVNALVAFAFSLLFVRLFKLDIATSLINTYSGLYHPENWPGMLLTAFIIAGGSRAVNRILQALGFRAVSSQQQPTPNPPLTEAWIAVTLVREKAVGPVTVSIGQAGHITVAGTISSVTPGRSWWRYFVRDEGRFPQTGGFSVTPGKAYEVILHGMDRTGNPVRSKTWGPYELGPGSHVDIELSA